MNNLSSTTDNVSSDFVAIINSGIDNTSGDSAGDPDQLATVRPDTGAPAAWTMLLIMFPGLPTRHPQDDEPAHTMVSTPDTDKVAMLEENGYPDWKPYSINTMLAGSSARRDWC